MQKKWNNIQTRVKGKMAQRNKTGGGPAIMLNTNDDLALKIIGEENPKMAKVPGAITSETGEGIYIS